MVEDTRIISSKDILSAVFYELDMAANTLLSNLQFYQRNDLMVAYANIILQQKRLINVDIVKKEKQEDFENPCPPMNATRKNIEEWMELSFKITDMARETGLVGRETAPWGDSLLRDFEE